MNNKIKKSSNKEYQLGFSIVELMISVFIGLIVLTGLITVFETTSNMNKTQTGLSRIQENGRFAILQMKQNIEQAGYQYCMSSCESECDRDNGTIQRPWLVYTADPILPGVPHGLGLLDAQYLIHGHECGNSVCEPVLTSDGSDTSFTMPGIGTADGSRLAGTDVLTIRYVRGSGLEIDNIVNDNSGEAIITLTDYSAAGTSSITDSSRVLVAQCDGNPLVATDVASTGTGVITVKVPPGEDYRNGVSLAKVFDLDTDVMSVTYYVANNIIDGRSTPTLYSVNNGTVNALVEGVDRFDVLYGVSTGQYPNKLISYFTADGVENMDPTLCSPLDEDSTAAGFVNDTGCGWRNVELIEIHMLLNTVNDSSSIDDEPFFYSIDGSDSQTPSDLITGIDHYNMHRREFFSVIHLKNKSE